MFETLSTLEDVNNVATVNIFTDASMSSDKKNQLGCHGAVVVYMDTIVACEKRLDCSTTNNRSELRGIRLALDIARHYIDRYPFINIFSDSKLSINSLTEYLPALWNININGEFYNRYSKKVIKNSDLLMEDKILLDILQRSSTIIRLRFVPSHVNINDKKSLKKAWNSYNCNNDFYTSSIDYDLIHFLCKYNNYIDEVTRSLVKLNCDTKINYCDPISFLDYRKY